MNERVETLAQESATPSIDRILRNLLIKKIQGLSLGKLTIVDPIGQVSLGAEGEGLPSAQITVRNTEFYRKVAFGGALGAAESYMDGDWVADNLVDIVRIMVLNQDTLAGLEGGAAVLTRPFAWLFQKLNRNTLAGSKKNIHAHYDLGNDFFRLFLDKKMMYSNAYFEHEDQSLDDAAAAKLERICRKLSLTSEDHVLEIGTGWGGFAIYAAKNFGCRVTTTTISKKQYEFAVAAVQSAQLTDRITVLLQVYRLLTGTYDKLVSIEMIEAVGADFLDKYIETCSLRLKENGSMLIQAITINDQLYDRALKETDFMKRHIFPGSFIPSLHAIMSSVKRASNLRLYHLDDMTPHYAKTLLQWRERFLSQRGELKRLGYDERFQRTWDYYFCYCIGGFLERSIGSVQLVFGKPGFRDNLGKFTSVQRGN